MDKNMPVYTLILFVFVAIASGGYYFYIKINSQQHVIETLTKELSRQEIKIKEEEQSNKDLQLQLKQVQQQADNFKSQYNEIFQKQHTVGFLSTRQSAMVVTVPIEPEVTEQHAFNIDFGPLASSGSQKSGPAVVGDQGDFWNAVAVNGENEHTQINLKSTKGQYSPIKVQMINLAGGWSCSGKMGVKDSMLDDFNYPVNNQGGNSQVILKNVPQGNYQIYIYGHGTDPMYYGDYTVSVAGKDYGRKATSNGKDAIENTQWVEGSQYVKFDKVIVGESGEVNILIQPGAAVSDNGFRSFADAMIAGLQLVPIK